MNSTQVREHGGLRLWLLLVTIGVALVAALGIAAKPAWAEGAGTEDDPVETAAQLAAKLTAQDGGSVSVSDNVVTVNGTAEYTSTESDLYISPSTPLTLTINGTLNLTGSYEPSLNINGGGNSLTINGSGSLVSGAGVAIIIEPKDPVASPASVILDGGINITSTESMGVYVDKGTSTGSGSSLIVNNANITGHGGPAVVIRTGSGSILGGFLYTDENKAQALQAGINVVVGNAATGVGPTITSESGPGIVVFYMGDLTLNAGTISGGTYGVAVNNNPAADSDYVAPEGITNNDVSCTINGGTIDGAQAGVQMLSTANGQVGNQNLGAIDVAINGGTVTAPEGKPAVNNVANPPSAGSSSANSNAMTIGSQNNSGPTLKGDVVNAGSGTMSIQSGQIDGNLENTSSQGGTIEWSGGQVTGEVVGVDKVTPPAEPGTAEALQGAVIGVKAPVTAAMAPYATVTVNSAGNVWNIEVVDGAEATPVSTIASTLVVPIVNAIASASSPSVTSVQNSALTITLPNTADEVLSFSQGVLEAAVVNTNMSLAQPATLGELEGLTCGINAATNTGSVTYTFNFAGEAPEPPAADYEAVYRLYNPYDFLHIYTRDAAEVANLKAAGWTVDFGGQPCWYAPVAGSEDASYQVIRLYNPYSHDHYFVPASDTDQIDELTGLGWQKDSAASAIWSAPAEGEGSVEVYTLFNRYNQVDTHLWTASKTEVDTLVGPDAWELNTTTMWGVTPA